MSRKMVYEWRPDARVNLDAQEVGEYLSKLERQHKGVLAAEVVVAEAKARKSPLHSYFEWDDGRAADLYRLEQARYVIRHLVVKADDPRLPDKPLRAFVHVETPKGNGYMNMSAAMSNKDIRDQVIRKALSELSAWRVRYNELRELGQLFDAIEAAEVLFA